MIKIIGCLLLVVVVSCAHAEIQCDNAPAKRLMFKFDAPYPEEFSNPDLIYQHYKNLSDMSDVLSGIDNQVANDDVNSVSILQTKFNFMQDLGDLYIRMCLVKDAVIVKNAIIKFNTDLQKSCDHELKFFNKRLTLISNKALISEAEKTRDDLTKSCEGIRVWAEQLH